MQEHPYPVREPRPNRQPIELPPPDKTAAVEPLIAAETLPKQGRGDILSDVLGSYTGSATDHEPPEQDADDL